MIPKSLVTGIVVATSILTAQPALPNDPAGDNATTQTEAAPDLNPVYQMHWENRTKSFRDQNLVYKNVVLLGDSITEGFEVEKYLPGRRVLNRGIGADVIGNDIHPTDKRGVLKRLDESVFHCSPTDLFILIGINDLGMGHSPETIEAGYRQMLTQIRERLPKLRIHVQSILPTGGRFAHHKTNIIDTNTRIKKLAAEFDCEYIDLHAQFINDEGDIKAEYTTEGLHLAPPAYEKWAEILIEKLGW